MNGEVERVDFEAASGGSPRDGLLAAVRDREVAAIRVMIVDDHRLFSRGIQLFLEDAGATVVAVATTAAGALEAVERERPDLVIVDIKLPDESGLHVGREVLERFPGTRVVAVTGVTDVEVMREAIGMGFGGFLTKDTPVGEFVGHLKAILGGQVVVTGRLKHGAEGASAPADQDAALLARQLTPRELEVLSLLAEGTSGPKIARRLDVSSNTVRTHIQNILTKLQVHSRLEAAAFAVRHGIVKPPTRTPPQE